MLTVEIAINEKSTWVDALIDSGADYNMAPIELATMFQLDLEKYPYIEVGGIEQAGRIKLSIVPIRLKLGGHEIQSYMGFGGNLPTILLGQKGFFDKFKKINFEYPKSVEIKMN